MTMTSRSRSRRSPYRAKIGSINVPRLPLAAVLVIGAATLSYLGLHMTTTWWDFVVGMTGLLLFVGAAYVFEPRSARWQRENTIRANRAKQTYTRRSF